MCKPRKQQARVRLLGLDAWQLLPEKVRHVPLATGFEARLNLWFGTSVELDSAINDLGAVFRGVLSYESSAERRQTLSESV